MSKRVEELIVSNLLVHHWEKQTNRGGVYNCNYWDCSHKIHEDEVFYLEMYPGGHALSHCLECSSFFMAQAVNTLIENWGQGAAWDVLYKVFAERLDQKNIDLMDSILSQVETDMQEEAQHGL